MTVTISSNTLHIGGRVYPLEAYEAIMREQGPAAPQPPAPAPAPLSPKAITDRELRVMRKARLVMTHTTGG